MMDFPGAEPFFSMETCNDFERFISAPNYPNVARGTKTVMRTREEDDETEEEKS